MLSKLRFGFAFSWKAGSLRLALEGAAVLRAFGSRPRKPTPSVSGSLLLPRQKPRPAMVQVFSSMHEIVLSAIYVQCDGAWLIQREKQKKDREMIKRKVEKYEENIAELFKRWKTKPPKDGIDHGRNVFISDGVACPDQWFSQDVRPLLLLKEAYNGSRDWDLRDHFMKDDIMIGNITWRSITQ